MPCYHPRPAWRNADGGAISFVEKRNWDIRITIPCGWCIGCRVGKRDDQALRSEHECTLHDVSCFVTLTYADEHCPLGLDHRHWQLFLKRLRFVVAKRGGARFRFSMCGEYGHLNRRPHFHGILYGYWPPDAVRLSGDLARYSSVELDLAWGLGFTQLSPVTPAVCRYVAKHNSDKLFGEAARKAYAAVVAGEVVQLRPEYGCSSRRPGIGGGFVDRFKGDLLHPEGVPLKGGARAKLPRYYLERIAKSDLAAAARLEEAAQLASLDPRREADRTPERLAVRERVKLAGIASTAGSRKL